MHEAIGHAGDTKLGCRARETLLIKNVSLKLLTSNVRFWIQGFWIRSFRFMTRPQVPQNRSKTDAIASRYVISFFCLSKVLPKGVKSSQNWQFKIG